jgi:hypothetical protein
MVVNPPFVAAIAGLCGGAAAVNYVWCTELLPSSSVASVTAAISSAFSCGVVFVAVWAYLLLEIKTANPGPGDVALLGCVTAGLPLLYLGLAAKELPETPAWLISVRKTTHAKNTF